MFLAIMLALKHRLFQFLLVIGKQSMNLAVRFVADSVNLRTKLLPRSRRILIEQRLNPIMVCAMRGQAPPSRRIRSRRRSSNFSATARL